MSNMKCPFCQQELEIGGVDGILRGCPKCRNLGTEMLWQELIRTRKALDVAVDALKLFDSGQYTPQPDAYGLKTDASRLARKALDEIKTALEQKE